MNDSSIKIYEVLDLAPLRLILGSPSSPLRHPPPHTQSSLHCPYLKGVKMYLNMDSGFSDWKIKKLIRCYKMYYERTLLNICFVLFLSMLSFIPSRVKFLKSHLYFSGPHSFVLNTFIFILRPFLRL